MSIVNLSPLEILKKREWGFVQCCDIGFDFDDHGALMIGLLEEKLVAIITGLYRPDEKKSLVTAFLKVFKENQTTTESMKARIDQVVGRVFSGEGYYPDSTISPEKNKEIFIDLFPRWPIFFGDPSVSSEDPHYKCIYPNQAKAYCDNGIVLDPLCGHSELDDFAAFLEELKEPVIYVSTGPTKNLATLLRKYPDLVKAKIKTTVMMNGTFATPAKTARMGYNGGLNFEDTQTVFDSGIPCLIVPSALAAEYTFPKEIMHQMTAKRDQLSPFGKLLHDIMLSWEIHRARKRDPNVDPSKLSLDNPILADPLTMLIALHPELVESVRSVKYTFTLTKNDIHLLHPDAPALVLVEDDPDSSVFEVTSLVSHEKTLEMLLEKLTIQ